MSDWLSGLLRGEDIVKEREEKRAVFPQKPNNSHLGFPSLFMLEFLYLLGVLSSSPLLLSLFRAHLKTFPIHKMGVFEP